jgi:hypothetical protein
MARSAGLAAAVAMTGERGQQVTPIMLVVEARLLEAISGERIGKVERQMNRHQRVDAER